MKIKKLLLPGMALAFAGSLALRAWTSGVYYRPLPPPAAAVPCWPVLLQVCAWKDGVHFLAMRTYGERFLSLQLGRATNLGRGGYHHGFVVSVLGFAVAVLPRTHHGGDYVVSPHVAFVFPYWLLMVMFGWLFLRYSGIAALLRPYCRSSRTSICSAVAVLVTLAVLNLAPSAWRPGSKIEPEGLKGWAALTFAPGSSHSEIMLEYGFPFECYRRGTINGESVDYFYGADTGWEQHMLMDNVCLAALATIVPIIAAEWLRRRVIALQSPSADNAQPDAQADGEDAAA